MGLRFASALLGLALTAASAAAAEPPQVTLSGTRIVIDYVAGGPPVLATAYPVVEHDVGQGTRVLTFGPPVAAIPAFGLQPIAESFHSVVIFPDGTPVESLSIDAESGIDRGAHQPYEVDDVRSVTTTDLAELAATERVVEAGVGTTGVSFASEDLVRTTSLDGSFDESGSVSTLNTHSLHVGADFAASSHDETPGFSLRDVTTSPFSSDRPTSTIQVTVAFRGRTVGNVPIVTKSYTVRRWFPVQPRPTVAERVVTPNVPLPFGCYRAPAPPTAALLVHVRRMQIDPTGSTREIKRDTYYDASNAALCRVERSSTLTFDVTTGTQTGLHDERTVLARAAP
jgi:hypothetical protein